MSQPSPLPPDNQEHSAIARIKKSPWSWVAATIGGTIVLVITIFEFLGFVVVHKDSYILLKDLKERYVEKEKYEALVTKVKIQKENSPNLANSDAFRKVKIFENDSIDYYGIFICSYDSFDQKLIEARKKLKNGGFPNTEIFRTNENKYCVIVYGYATMGSGIKKNVASVKRMMKEHKGICCVDLTTLATEGFVEYKEKNVFKYFIPRGAESIENAFGSL